MMLLRKGNYIVVKCALLLYSGITKKGACDLPSPVSVLLREEIRLLKPFIGRMSIPRARALQERWDRATEACAGLLAEARRNPRASAGARAFAEAVAATIPMGRMATPDDVASACLLLGSPGAAYITGTELVVDGGGEIPARYLAAGIGSTSSSDGRGEQPGTLRDQAP